MVVSVSPAAAAGTATFTNAVGITIRDNTTAAPYPSAIAVSGLSGAISDVTVTLNDFSHSVVHDVDVLLVSPTGRKLMLMSDVAQDQRFNQAHDITLGFSDAATTSVPETDPLLSGTFLPTNDDSVGPDVFAPPVPAGPIFSTFASAYAGTAPNGTWSLYVDDDTAGDGGNIASWSLTVTTSNATVASATTVDSSAGVAQTGAAVTFTANVSSDTALVAEGTVTFLDGAAELGGPVAVDANGQASLTTSTLSEGAHSITASYNGSATYRASQASVPQRIDHPTSVSGTRFCNTGPLTIPASGAASPYPSRLNVRGMGSATAITAELNDVTHSSLPDLDVLLVGPAGQSVILLSDAGATGSGAPASLTFSDAAPTSVPSAPVVTGTYRPTDLSIGGPDVLPPPATAPASAGTLDELVEAGVDGEWTLYVVDDSAPTGGSIAGGWCLNFRVPIPTVTRLISSDNPSVAGADVTFTATVSAVGDRSPASAGTVDFFDGPTLLASKAVDPASGSATWTASALPVGAHPIHVAYHGANGYTDSGNSLDQQVNRVPSTTSVVAVASPALVGEPVALTAAVLAGPAAATTGTVDFSDGPTTLATGIALDANGRATFSALSLALGDHQITATYSGTPTVAASSGTVTERIVAPPPVRSDFAITTIRDGINEGDEVRMFIGVNTAVTGTVITQGTISLTDGTVVLATGLSLADGTANYVTSSLAVGVHTIIVTFSGTADNEPSSTSVTLTVRPRAVAGGPYAIAEGQSLTLDGRDSSAGANYRWDLNGDGDFSDAVGVNPTLSWSQLQALGLDDGPRTITGQLSVSVGDLLWQSELKITVQNSPPVVQLAGTTSVLLGSPFTLSLDATDPSAADSAAGFSYVIDWGDGGPVQTESHPSTFTLSHRYSGSGTFDVRVTASDKDGAVSEPSSFAVTVAQPPVPPKPPVPHSAPVPAVPGTGGTPDSGLASTGDEVELPLRSAIVLLLSGLALSGLRHKRGSSGL